MKFSIIVATDLNRGIGLYEDHKYSIPWTNKRDILFFKDITSNVDSKKKVVIMGKNTYNSLPLPKLPNRLNIVITKDQNLITEKDVLSFTSLNKALLECISYDEVFVIGGSKLYEEALQHKMLDKIYWNIISNTDCKCNIFFPMTFEEAKAKYKLDLTYDLRILNTKEITFHRFFCNKDNLDEIKYLKLLEKILVEGDKRKTRNAVTYSLFGEKLEFDLKDSFPLLTTKKMFLRGIFEELKWFLNGQTDSKILENKKVNIWKGNSSKEFIESVNLPYREGDIGGMYGWILKRAGTKYTGCDIDYTNQGFDQIEYCLNLLRNDKFSRRIIMTTYIPHEADKGVLYPCHGIAIQFYVKEKYNKNYLSCHMYQRSADMFLGVPFNIASYGLIVYMFCEILNNKSEIKFTPDKLVMSFGDIHIYEDHLDQVKEQIKRKPLIFPQILFNCKKEKLEDFNWEDVEILGYNSYPSIKANMVT